MALGMSYEQFWYGDVRDFPIFVEAHKKRLELQNWEAWLKGLYDYDAFAVALTNFANLFSKSHREPVKYPSKPYDLFQDEREKDEEEQAEKERLWAKAYMKQMVQAGKNWGKQNSLTKT